MLKRFCSFVMMAMLAVVLIFAPGCEPIPGRQLTAEEKQTDMLALISRLQEYYSPMEYKAERFPDKFDWARIKHEYIAKAVATQNNDQFYEVLHEFVAQFRDAHTSLRLGISNLPGRTTISYLGFGGERMGDEFLVTELMPSILTNDGSKFPIKPGDIITHVNGRPFKEYVLTEMVKYRDLGHELANFTFHANAVFNRLSTQNGVVPKGSNIQLTLKGGRTITMPWTVRDFHEFEISQELIKKAASEKIQTLPFWPKGRNADIMALTFLNFEGNPLTLNTNRLPPRKSRFSKARKYLETFAFDPGFVRWTARPLSANPMMPKIPEGMDKLRRHRAVPENIIPIAEAKTFPAYIRPIPKRDDKGRLTEENELMGYILVDTFSPEMADETDVLNQVRTTLDHFQRMGVRKIVVDTLNNGGGSVSLVYQLAQLFSNEKLNNHGIRFGLNENWITDFQRGELYGPSDAENTISGRIYNELKTERETHPERRISKKIYPIEDLLPFMLEPNRRLKKKFDIVLLQNEMCASAADIFADTMVRNGLAVPMGEDTMGAGGNVTSHTYFQTPNAHAKISTTESLIVAVDGTHIENNGSKATIKIDTSLGVARRYGPIVDMAFAVLSNDEVYQAALAARPVQKGSVVCANALY